MSRTPLFRALRHSLRLARYSLHAGRDAREAVEECRERAAVTRREFLAASAMTAATVAAGGCGSIPAPRSAGEPPTVLVIGAGIAGLVAGYRLAQAGVPVRIFEAQARVGGRMQSLRDHFPDGQVAELGGELIDSNHERLHALARELGLPLDDYAADDPALTRDLWVFGGQPRSETEVVDAFRPIAEAVERDLATIGDAPVSYRTPGRAEPLDRLSIAQWLDRVGARGWIRDLLDVGYTAEYGVEIDRQSALNLLLLIDPKPEPFRIYGESDERFHVRGGNDRIPRALAARLDGRIELGAVLEAVGQRADGWLVGTLRRGARSLTIAAPHLVLAIPFTLLRAVQLDTPLPPLKRRAIRELGYGTNAKLMVGFSERLWRTRYRSNGSVFTDLGLQTTWETSRLQPGGAGILTNFTGGTHGVELGRGTPREQADDLVRGLERVYPGIAATRAGAAPIRAHWPSHPFARGSYACYLVGQWTGFGGVEGERVGRLHFAGEHCSREAQGFMEGGCETGEAVAKAILEDLGRARRPPGIPTRRRRLLAAAT